MARGIVNVGGGGGGANIWDISPSDMHTVFASNGTTSYADVVNITGSGYLIAVSSGGRDWDVTGSAVVKITIDSTVVYEGGLSYNRAVAVLNVGTIGGLLRFNSSLRVEHKEPASSFDVYTLVQYIEVDAEDPACGDITASDINIVEVSTTNTSYTSFVNISDSGYLLSVHFIPNDYDQDFAVYCNIIIDSTTILDNIVANANQNAAAWIPAPIRFPMKFDSSLAINGKVSASSSALRGWIVYITK